MVNQQPPQPLCSESRKGINLFKSLVETKSEEMYYIRLVVLVQEGVSKTTLVKRLLQESISEVESTNGIEINVDKCGISLHNGEWKFHRGIVTVIFLKHDTYNNCSISCPYLNNNCMYKPLVFRKC